RIRRLLERRLQENRPHDQYHRTQDQRDELRVNQIGPNPDTIGFFFLDRSHAGGYPPVVQDAFANRVPDEEHQQEDQADDRDVVGLGDDEFEIGIERTEDEEHGQDAHHAIPNGITDNPLALPDNQNQRDDREQ